jgi:hypothetical protein
MTTADLIAATSHTLNRPAWAERGAPHVISTRVGFGDIAKAAGDLDRGAALRNASIIEVQRVVRGSMEAVFARLEPKVNPT